MPLLHKVLMHILISKQLKKLPLPRKQVGYLTTLRTVFAAFANTIVKLLQSLTKLTTTKDLKKQITWEYRTLKTINKQGHTVL